MNEFARAATLRDYSHGVPEFFRAYYRGHPHPMTPTIVAHHRIGGRVFEITRGKVWGKTYYGVSALRWTGEQWTEDHDASGGFTTLRAARSHAGIWGNLPVPLPGGLSS